MFITVNDLDFSILSESKDTRFFADVIAKVYPERLDAIADFLLGEQEFRAFFEGVTKEQITAGLGRPIFTLLSSNNGVATFPEAKFGDQAHLISFEFSDDLLELFYLSIDG